SNLYAGGEFTRAGGSAITNIARWNGSSWSALGSGFSEGDLRSLAVSGNNVYAGGYFVTAGGVPANYIAKWDGSSWSSLGSGVSGSLGSFSAGVSALAISGSDLYAGGPFSAAGGSTASGIAKWNGSSWSAMGAGMNSDVMALAVSGSYLYAGGYFTRAGGSTVNYIARWNGSTWGNVSTGMSGVPTGNTPTVFALAASDGDVYAGGFFGTAGGIPAKYIAKWNGSSWSALGSGMDNIV